MAPKPDVIEHRVEKTGHPVKIGYPEGRSAKDYNPTGYHKITGRDFSELICTPMQKQIEVEFQDDGIEVTNLSDRSFKAGSIINITLDRRVITGDSSIVQGITNTARMMDAPANLSNVANPDAESTGGQTVVPVPEQIVTPEVRPEVDPELKTHPLENKANPDAEAQLKSAQDKEVKVAEAEQDAVKKGEDPNAAVEEAKREADRNAPMSQAEKIKASTDPRNEGNTDTQTDKVPEPTDEAKESTAKDKQPAKKPTAAQQKAADAKAQKAADAKGDGK